MIKVASKLSYCLQYTARNDQWKSSTQPAITCSKLRIEALEQGVKYFISHLVQVFLLLTLSR